MGASAGGRRWQAFGGAGPRKTAQPPTGVRSLRMSTVRAGRPASPYSRSVWYLVAAPGWSARWRASRSAITVFSCTLRGPSGRAGAGAVNASSRRMPEQLLWPRSCSPGLAPAGRCAQHTAAQKAHVPPPPHLLSEALAAAAGKRHSTCQPSVWLRPS